MASYVTPKKNTAFKFYVGLVDQSNTKLLKANPTIAAGDFKVSTDGAAFANLATLPSANPASGRAVMIDLSAGEMNGDNIVVQCVDAAGAEWCDLFVNIQTTANQIDEIYSRIGAPAGASVSADIAAVKAQTAAIETDTGTDIPAALTTIDDFLDTEVAAIKAKTDQLTFTVANQVDANVQAVNDVALQGDGTAGNSWRPV